MPEHESIVQALMTAVCDEMMLLDLDDERRRSNRAAVLKSLAEIGPPGGPPPDVLILELIQLFATQISTVIRAARGIHELHARGITDLSGAINVLGEALAEIDRKQ